MGKKNKNKKNIQQQQQMVERTGTETNAPQTGVRFNKVRKFLSLRWLSLILSFALIAGGVAAYFVKGGFTLGIDFLPGMRVEFAVDDDSITLDDVRSAMEVEGLESEVTTVGTGETRNFLLTIAGEQGETMEDFNIDDVKELEALIMETFGEETVEIRGTEFIGARIAREFGNRSIKLILAVAVLILMYVAIRFDFFYGAGAIAALFHDIAIMLAFSLFLDIRIDITVVAAMLTILGYSINDSIVVFDRVRENHALNPDEDYEHVMNKSITQSLSRTFVTSITTLFVAVSIYIWGGRVLKDFGLELVVGIVSGTYSSIFIASPITFILKSRLDKDTHVAALEEKKELKK